MFSRSVKAATSGRTALSPLSPLPTPYSTRFASISAAVLEPEQQQRLYTLRSARKVGKVLGAPPLPESQDLPSPRPLTGSLFGGGATPATATAYGYDATIMERLQTSLASPFSPKTFARSILSPALKTPAQPDISYRPAPTLPVSRPLRSQVGGWRSGALKPRRKAPPSELPLDKPSRLTDRTPLSPFRFPSSVNGTVTSPVSPAVHASPITTLTDTQIRLQKVEKLARCLGEHIPKEFVYPSISQVTEKPDQVVSYLELYRHGGNANGTSRVSLDDTALDVRSPVPRDAHWEHVAMGETELERKGSLKKSKSIRRSRSVGDFYSLDNIRELQSLNTRMAEREKQQQTLVRSPIAEGSEENTTDVVGFFSHKRTTSNTTVASAKATIINKDAQSMASFRLGFNTPRSLSSDSAVNVRPSIKATLPAPAPAPTRPLPHIPLPTSLTLPTPITLPEYSLTSPNNNNNNNNNNIESFLFVKSPRAPYWVKPNQIKTPRTRRFERRMGWGGSWTIGSMGDMVNQLKEL